MNFLPSGNTSIRRRCRDETAPSGLSFWSVNVTSLLNSQYHLCCCLYLSLFFFSFVISSAESRNCNIYFAAFFYFALLYNVSFHTQSCVYLFSFLPVTLRRCQYLGSYSLDVNMTRE